MITDPETVRRIETRRAAVVAAIEPRVKEWMKSFPPCHDWAHIQRTRWIGRKIALKEGADTYIVDLALLLHDVADPKFKTPDSPASAELAREIMWECKVQSSVVIEVVSSIIEGLPFYGRGIVAPMLTLEGGVVQDADMLDAMGAIGIARAFTTGAIFGQPLYVPDDPAPGSVKSSRAPRRASTIDHFRSKLLHLKRRMNTGEGKRLAKRRHSELAKFVHKFKKEWNLEM